MIDTNTYNELLGIKASAELLAERADRLIRKEKKERGISISSSKKTKKGLSAELSARILGNKRKTQLKQSV